MNQPSLWDAGERQMADTSLQAWRERIQPKLTRKEILVYRALVAYLEVTGYADATGGELTEFMKARLEVRDVNGCRPRLSNLEDKGWVLTHPKRRCLAYTTDAHPYSPVVPISALHDLNPDDGGR